MSSRSSPRKRNAEQTRRMLLETARRQFSQQGYDQVGLREIAKEAGVDPALAIRYFGSKESLFAESLSGDSPISSLLSTLDIKALPDLMCQLTAGSENPETPDALLTLLRSATSPEAAPLVSRMLNDAFIVPLSERLGGPQADTRAALAAALILGTKLLRNQFKLPAFQPPPEEALIALFNLLFFMEKGDTAVQDHNGAL